MNKFTLRDFNLVQKKVLMRVDFNVPMRDGTIIDDSRILQSLPSIQYVLKKRGKLILMSHLGRPEGKYDHHLSLAPCARHLERLLKQKVLFAPECIGVGSERLVESMKGGELLLLENLRFHRGEEHPEEYPNFVKALAPLGEIYIDDAFGAAHRNHASITSIIPYFPRANGLGFLMQREVERLSYLLDRARPPFYAIIGGAKVSSKIGMLQALVPKINGLFIGGGMAFAFLKVLGVEIGDSVCDNQSLLAAKKLMRVCEEKGVSLHLPIDLRVSVSPFDQHAPTNILLVKEGIPRGWRGVDIGPKTLEQWNPILKKGQTIFWNGPMGIFEIEPFAQGTFSLAKMLGSSKANRIVGGGDSISAIHQMKMETRFTHLSTGGGASLKYLEHGSLPGVEALSNKL